MEGMYSGGQSRTREHGACQTKDKETPTHTHIHYEFQGHQQMTAIAHATELNMGLTNGTGLLGVS